MFATRPNGWPGNPRTLTRKSNENLVPIVPLKYRRAETFSVSTIRFLMQMRPRKRKARKNWKRRIPLLALTWQRQKNNSTNLKWRFVCIKNLNKQSCRLKKCRNFLSTKILSPVATHKTMFVLSCMAKTLYIPVYRHSIRRGNVRAEQRLFWSRPPEIHPSPTLIGTSKMC